MPLRSIYCSRKGLIMKFNLFKKKKRFPVDTVTITAIPIDKSFSFDLKELESSEVPLPDSIVDLAQNLMKMLNQGNGVEAIKIPEIKDVVFNNPATIVFWEDGVKTIVKCQPEDTYSKEVGLVMAIVKRIYGNNGKYNELFAKWLKED